MNLFGLVTGFMAGVVFFPWFGSLGLLVATAAGVLLDAASRRPGAFGTETAELVVRLYSLWGLLVRDQLTQAQLLFLRGTAGQLRLGGTLARTAFESFERGRSSAESRPWPEMVSLVSSAASELDEEFFLDRRTLLWIYAASRRLVALGEIRPGVAELLDVVARAFGILDEVGAAGLGGQGDPYEKAWRNFRPGSQVSPEAYATLGVSPSASIDEIKKAYRSLVRAHHPDAHFSAEAEKSASAEKFLQIQQAYERIRRSRNF